MPKIRQKGHVRHKTGPDSVDPDFCAPTQIGSGKYCNFGNNLATDLKNENDAENIV